MRARRLHRLAAHLELLAAYRPCCREVTAGPAEIQSVDYVREAEGGSVEVGLGIRLDFGYCFRCSALASRALRPRKASRYQSIHNKTQLHLPLHRPYDTLPHTQLITRQTSTQFTHSLIKGVINMAESLLAKLDSSIASTTNDPSVPLDQRTFEEAELVLAEILSPEQSLHLVQSLS